MEREELDPVLVLLGRIRQQLDDVMRMIEADREGKSNVG